MGLLDPLDWMEYLVFLVPRGPLEQQVSLDSEEKRETVGSRALQEDDRRVIRATLGCQAHLDSLD